MLYTKPKLAGEIEYISLPKSRVNKNEVWPYKAKPLSHFAI